MRVRFRLGIQSHENAAKTRNYTPNPDLNPKNPKLKFLESPGLRENRAPRAPKPEKPLGLLLAPGVAGCRVYGFRGSWFQGLGFRV